MIYDLYVQVKTEVPIYLNRKQKELEQFREIEMRNQILALKIFFKSKNFWKLE